MLSTENKKRLFEYATHKKSKYWQVFIKKNGEVVLVERDIYAESYRSYDVRINGYEMYGIVHRP